MNSMHVLLFGLMAWGGSTAPGQVMRLTGFSDEIEADYYFYNIEHTDWEESGGYIQHHRMPWPGTMTFEATVDFSDPQATFDGFYLKGDVEGTGPFELMMGGDMTVAQLPSGKWSFRFMPSPVGDMFLETGFVLEPSVRLQAPIYFSLRSYRPVGQSYGDTSLWPIFSHVELTPIDLTPIPEPATTALCGVLTVVTAVALRVGRKTKACHPTLS